MNKVSVRSVRDLEANARQVVQQLIGRRLREEEQVSIRVSSPHPAPRAAARRAAVARLERAMDQAAAKAKHIPSKKLDKLISEALSNVRGAQL